MAIDMQKHKWWLLALLIGAAGSALWDIALKPGLFWFGLWLVRISTLGLSNLVDDVYAEVAKGFHEGTSILILGILIGILSGYMLAMVRKWHFSKTDNKKPPSKVADISMVVLGIVLGLFFFSRASYTNRALAHFHQTLSIVSIQLDLQAKQVYLSRFSAMTTRKEYHDLMNELYRLADEHHLKVPEFQKL